MNETSHVLEPPTDEELAAAKVLVLEGWRQISRKYRTIARLPDGMDGRTALRWAMLQYDKAKKLPEHEEEWIESLDERAASLQFLRVYTSYPFAEHLHRTLTPREFNAFRLAGGVST